jgi:hypothetical protein
VRRWLETLAEVKAEAEDLVDQEYEDKGGSKWLDTLKGVVNDHVKVAGAEKLTALNIALSVARGKVIAVACLEQPTPVSQFNGANAGDESEDQDGGPGGDDDDDDDDDDNDDESADEDSDGGKDDELAPASGIGNAPSICWQPKVATGDDDGGHRERPTRQDPELIFIPGMIAAACCFAGFMSKLKVM